MSTSDENVPRVHVGRRCALDGRLGYRDRLRRGQRSRSSVSAIHTGIEHQTGHGGMMTSYTVDRAGFVSVNF